MDSRTGLGRFRDFRISNYELMMQLIDACMPARHVEEILALPDVAERVELFREQRGLFVDQLRRVSRVQGDVVVVDLRGEDIIHAGNRFMVYALFPEARVSVHVIWGKQKLNTVLAVGKSILDRTSPADIGSMMLGTAAAVTSPPGRARSARPLGGGAGGRHPRGRPAAGRRPDLPHRGAEGPGVTWAAPLDVGDLPGEAPRGARRDRPRARRATRGVDAATGGDRPSAGPGRRRPTFPPAAGSPGTPNVTSRTNRAARNVPPAAGRAGDRLDDRTSSFVGSFSSYANPALTGAKSVSVSRFGFALRRDREAPDAGDQRPRPGQVAAVDRDRHLTRRERGRERARG